MKRKIRIEAVTVNHNTSPYTELMLRSLFAMHSNLNISLTIYDNASKDDMSGLRTYAESKGIPIIQSGFNTELPNNSHGAVLNKFVLEHPECTYYLFLDADVCFIENNTVNKMMEELEEKKNVFGIGPRLSWDGKKEMPENEYTPDIYKNRLHPCCALIKNTELFRRVVKEIGLSYAKCFWENDEEYLDTFKLMTKVMKTHRLKHIISSKMVIHFFCVSYVWKDSSKQWEEAKANRRDKLLRKFRKMS